MCALLLDLSAAFDTVNHSILLTFVREYVGVDGSAINLFDSFLTEMTQCVSVESVLSEFNALVCGIPQGSVLGPIEF